MMLMNKFGTESVVRNSCIWYKLEGNMVWKWPWNIQNLTKHKVCRSILW